MSVITKENEKTILSWEDAPDILTVEEASKLIRCGINQMYDLCKSQNFPMIRTGRRAIRIPKNLFKLWVEKQAENSI